MTASDRFDRVFTDALADLAQPAYPDYIEVVLHRATRGSQRPVWMFPERWIPMSTIARSVPFAPGLPWRNLAILMILLLATVAAVVVAGTQRQPAPPYGPAENGLLAYQVEGDIFTRDIEGGPSTLLGGGPDVDVAPLFSRDGLKIAFVRIDPTQPEFGTAKEAASLMVANADGSDLHRVFGPAIFQWWVWSPNSQALAVVAPTDRGQELSVVPVDGTGARVLALDRAIVGGAVEWRPPDGRELILQLASGGMARFFAVPVDGGPPRQITREETLVPTGGAFTLAPDGRQLVYEHLGDVISLRILDIETGDERPFGENLPPLVGGPFHVGAPQLSSDGNQLIFGRYWDDDGTMLNHQMWTAALAGDGSDAKPIGSLLRSQGGALPFLVTSAPDGSRVVVHRTGSGETWSTNLGGDDLQSLDLGDFEWLDWQRLPGR